MRWRYRQKTPPYHVIFSTFLTLSSQLGTTDERNSSHRYSAIPVNFPSIFQTIEDDDYKIIPTPVADDRFGMFFAPRPLFRPWLTARFPRKQCLIAGGFPNVN
ncbi:hypothetical protein GWI33_018191 [Rhynchophorus ferrugineus]|uniref:Uncharacterized protein n=1 Tax=Rhynchophorus ferrugineus TaxID=354439 RepID=A0A834M5I4_RHYFE|nr:hypothetical protein GWI33_018191 [Rhynchophorus ferrugineus]